MGGNLGSTPVQTSFGGLVRFAAGWPRRSSAERRRVPSSDCPHFSVILFGIQHQWPAVRLPFLRDNSRYFEIIRVNLTSRPRGRGAFLKAQKQTAASPQPRPEQPPICTIACPRGNLPEEPIRSNPVKLSQTTKKWFERGLTQKCHVRPLHRSITPLSDCKSSKPQSRRGKRGGRNDYGARHLKRLPKGMNLAAAVQGLNLGIAFNPCVVSISSGICGLGKIIKAIDFSSDRKVI